MWAGPPRWTRKAFGGEQRKPQASFRAPLQCSPQIPACFALSTVVGSLAKRHTKSGPTRKQSESCPYLEPVSLSAGPPRSCSTHFTPHLTDSHQECNINRPHLRPLKELLSARRHTRQFPASPDLFGGSPAAHSCPTGSAPALLPRHG